MNAYSRPLLIAFAVLLTTCLGTGVMADSGDDVVKNFMSHVDGLDQIDRKEHAFRLENQDIQKGRGGRVIA